MSDSYINRRCHVYLDKKYPSYHDVQPPSPDSQATRPGDVAGNLDAYFHAEERRYHALGRLEGDNTAYPAGHDHHMPRNLTAGYQQAQRGDTSQYSHPNGAADTADLEAWRKRRHRQAQVHSLGPAAVAEAVNRASAGAPPIPERGDWAVIEQAEARQVSRPVARVTRDSRTSQPVLLPLHDDRDDEKCDKKRSSRLFGCFR